MKTKKQILAFEQLESEMELIFADQMHNFIGGEGSSGGGYEYGIDSSGNLYYRPVGSDTWAAYNQLDEVEITGFASSGSSGSSGFSYPTGFDWGNWNDMDNSYSNGYYGPNGTTYPNGAPGPLLGTGPSNMSFLDIASALNMSIGLTLDWTTVSAQAMDLKVASALSTTGRVFVVADVAMNVYEIFDNEASYNERLEDTGQILATVALCFIGGPVAIAGGIALAGWSLYELNRDD